MNDAWNHDSSRGRVYPIVLAVLAIMGAAVGAAWLAMGDAPGHHAKGSMGTDRSETRVLAARIDAPDPSEAPSTTGSDAPATTAPTTGAPTTTAPISSTGRFAAAGTTGEVRGSGDVHTYSVEAEDGSGVVPDQLADIVDVILSDSRGWTAKGYAFQRVPSGGDFTISLATPATTDEICAPLDTAGRFSCHEGHRVVLNLTRWNEGTTELPLDLNEYRAEVVNHEVGHELGLGHTGCGGAGLRAPVMMQQSKGLDGCTANPWPTLDGT
jgi:hypothetical protein